MKEDHILLQRATRRPYREVPELPPLARYDAVLGHWMLDDAPLVNSREFGPNVTKKCDQETGEDQKGQ